MTLLVCLIWLGRQGHLATQRFASDGRNPYAYVPTVNDAERMKAWLQDLLTEQPALNEEPVAVVGSFFWPLPWYLRSFDEIGYWDALPDGAADRPLLFVLPTAGEEAAAALATSHQLFPRGLRYEFPVIIAIRKDLWESLP